MNKDVIETCCEYNEEKNNLWGANMFSQIVYFQNGDKGRIDLAITTNREQHDSLIRGFKRQGIRHEALYLYSNR